MSNVDQLLTFLEQSFGIGDDIVRKSFFTLLVFFVLWLARMLAQRSLVDRIKDPRVRYQWNKSLGYIGLIFGFIIVLAIWLEGLGSLATYFGLLSAGLAVTLKDPIVDIMGWAFILWRRPFEVGDRIQIGEQAGDVIDLRFFQFSLMEVGNWVHADQSTGRVLHIPNSQIFTTVLANYTKGSDYIWNELPVLVTFESDWEKAKDILSEIAQGQTDGIQISAEASFRKAAGRYMLQYGKLSSIVYTSIEESGVLLTIRYLCKPHNRRDSANMMWEAILRAFAPLTDVDFAYPTQRFYNNRLEGKDAGSPDL